MQPNVVTYNTLLKACMCCKDLQRAELALSWLQEQGVVPNLVTYHSLIKVASYSGNLERALRVPMEMRAAGVEPTLHIWSSLIVACGKVKHHACPYLAHINASHVALIQHHPYDIPSHHSS